MICLNCYLSGLDNFVTRRTNFVVPSTLKKYQLRGIRFFRAFQDGFVTSKRGGRANVPQRECVSRNDYQVFQVALLNFTRFSSAIAYSTPIMGAFDNAPNCGHC